LGAFIDRSLCAHYHTKISSGLWPRPAGLLAIAAMVRFDGFSDFAKRWYIADRGEQESFA
jgi:hypothetical protein